MKPKLYQYAACPFCNKVRSILRYKGIDFETIEVNPLTKKEIAFSPEYQAVPIYIDSSGRQINDSTPIMRSIDIEFPQRKVFALEGSADSIHEATWLAWSDVFVKGLPVVIYQSLPSAFNAFAYIAKVGKFNWRDKFQIRIFGSLVMWLVAKRIKKREQIGDPKEFLIQKSGEWVSGLEGRPFMGGINPNGADLALWGFCQSIQFLPAGKLLQSQPAFWAWHNRVADTVNSSSPALN